MSSGCILAPCASPLQTKVFENLVLTGIERERFKPYFSTYTDRVIHTYPIPESADIPLDDSAGDFVLFYTGSNEYTWAARIQEVRVNQRSAADLLEDVGLDDPERLEYSEAFLILDVPFQISRSSYEFHDEIGLDNDALTKIHRVPDQGLEGIQTDYGGLHDYLLEYRTDPSVWIEKTELDGRPYKQPGGEFELGSAVFSRSESADGRDIYWQLEAAEVGDIVIHLLQDRKEIVGLSVVSSRLVDDFEGPPDESWPEEARGEGYFRSLARYRELETPIKVYTDLLDDSDYRSRLQEIQGEHSNLFYDKNQELREGAYFTQCPLDLLYLITAEAPTLISQIRNRHYAVPMPDPVDSYDTVSETVADVRTRLPFSTHGRDWFSEQLTATIVREFTQTLTKIEPSGEISQEQAVHCELLATLYQDIEADLERTATDLGIGHIQQVDAEQALFFVLFRELQGRVGVSQNMDHVKTRVILNESYTVETPQRPPIADEEITPLPDADKPARADDIEQQLTEVGQLVFYGPPGTSKTYTATRFARWWLHQQSDVDPNTSHLTTVTFHPSFTYEDFLEGLSVETTDEGDVTYEHKSGVFKEIVQRARFDYENSEPDEPTPKYVLIIDEINRGNIAQIFGETITGLEYDKRLDQENETTVSLAHTGISFTIPPNLYLIGTMNTADRSIALVDAALRRRFRFLPFPPDYDALYEKHDFASRSDLTHTIRTSDDEFRVLLALSIEALHNLNDKIIDAADLGKGKQIGHSYLITVEETDDIVAAWRYEILPLLEEYHFGQFNRIREELFDGEGDLLMDKDSEQIKPFEKEELRTELLALVDLESSSDSTSSNETLELLYNAGIISAGEELVFKESRVPADTTIEYDSSDEFWRCRLTGNREQRETVEWLKDGSRHSLSGLTGQILRDATGREQTINGVDAWVHPEQDYRSLWDLREDAD